jgi:hypothetical protein
MELRPPRARDTLRAMRPHFLLPCLLLTACGHTSQKSEKAKAEARAKELQKLNVAATSEADSRLGAKAAGEVVYVDGGGGFVLLRARAGLTLAPEQELECRGKDARIKVTLERKGVFVAADIMSGEPDVGDAVIPVKGRSQPKLVPVAAPQGANDPANTIYVDPSSIRPEDLPNSTLNDPAMRPPDLLPEPTGREGMRVPEPPLPSLEEPPLPQ